MKIVLHNSYGCFINPEIDIKHDGSLVGYREALAKWLLSATKEIPTVQSGESSLAEAIERSKYKVVKTPVLSGGYRYIVRNATSAFSVLKVVEVDSSKMWLLHDYDGRESIRYYTLGKNNQLMEEK